MSTKPCTICKERFKPKKNAKTADERQLCPKCRKMVKGGTNG